MFTFLFLLIGLILAILSDLQDPRPRRVVLRKPEGDPEACLRLLHRLRKNGYQRIYTGLTRWERRFEQMVRALHRNGEAGEDHLEYLFYRYLQAVIKSRAGVIPLLNSPEEQRRFTALMRAIKFWHRLSMREVKDWKPALQVNLTELAAQLVAFLFQEYEVPPSVVSIWWSWHDPEVKDFCERFTRSGYRTGLNNGLFNLYFALTMGGSLRQNEELRIPISRRVAHVYRKSSIHLPFHRAYWWVVYIAAGGSQKYAWSVQRGGFRFEEVKFWTNFLQWLAQKETSSQFDLHTRIEELVSKVALLHLGGGPYMACEAYWPFAGIWPELKLAGQTPQSLWRKIRRVVRPEFPRPAGMLDEYILKKDHQELIRLVRLKNGVELEKEGQIMGHCVGEGSYDRLSLEGHISIWSLRKEAGARPVEHLLTIEVGDGHIREMEGPDGIVISDEHFALVDKWAEEQRLEAHPYLSQN